MAYWHISSPTGREGQTIVVLQTAYLPSNETSLHLASTPLSYDLKHY